MQSTTIGTLAGALAKARVEFKAAVKDASNPFFKSKYLTLAGCHDAIDEAMGKHGLAVIQTTERVDAGLVLVSTLAHSSGEWMSGQYPIKPIKEDPQGYGSALTYARRYALMALVGLAAEDDDGNEASGRPPAKIATATGEAQKKKPQYSAAQSLEAGNLRAEAIELGGEARFNELYRKMAYDQPSDFIDAATVLIRELRDIDNQAKQGDTK